MKKPYILEPTLPSRIQKYMAENKRVDVEDMTDYLMKTYREFRTKKRGAFIRSVCKIYKWELYCQKGGDNSSFLEDTDSSEIFEIDENGVQEQSDDIVELEAKKPSRAFSIDSLYRNNATPEKSASQNSNDNSKSKRKRKNLDGDDVQLNEIIKKNKNKKFEALKPTSSLEDMKGIESLYETACLFATNLSSDDLKVGAPKCVLLTGPSGSGKTSFVTALAGEFKGFLLKVPCTLLSGNLNSDAESPIKEAFKEAISIAPCILLLENLDVFSSKDSGLYKGPDKKICDQIQSCLAELETVNVEVPIMVIGETRQPQNIDLNLRSCFKMELFMPVLDKVSRSAVLQSLCPNVEKDFNFEEIALRTSSFVAGDLKDLSQRTRLVAWKRIVKENLGGSAFKNPKEFYSNYSDFIKGKTLTLTHEDFLQALPMVTPTLKREGFPMVPDTTWEDVGGLEDIKSELMEKILGPMQYSDLHEKFGAKKPNGIMLYGPPGCGKTLLAKAVANHAGVNLYAVMGPELLNMYQGESERAIREVFKRAASVAPCVIFFDEFDCICPRRSAAGDSGSKMTIVNTLLVEMNGFNQRKDVYVMAATNRPDMVDPAVLRPERFDTSLFVGLPDRRGRIAVLSACTKSGSKPRLDPDVDFSEISDWCENFSGADCAQLVYMASKAAIAEEIEKISDCALTTDSTKEEVGTLYKRHFVSAIQRVSPSVGVEEQRKYLRMKAKFESSRKEGKEVALQDITDGNPSNENKR